MDEALQQGYTNNYHQSQHVISIHTYNMRNLLPFLQLGSLESIELPKTPSDNILQPADYDSLSQKIIDTVFRIPCF